MKIFVLTAELGTKNGWARYSLDLVHALTQNGVQVSVGLSAHGQNEGAVEAVRMLPHGLDYFRSFFLAPWYAWRLRKYVRDCDYIHSFVEPYAYIAYWLAKFTGKKYVVTVHGSYGVLPYDSVWLRRRHHRALQAAYVVVCVSAYTKKVLTGYGLANLQVIHNGISSSWFLQEPVPTFNERENMLLSVGALKRRKGQHVSLAAFAHVAQEDPTLRYYIVGDQDDTPYVKRLQKLATELGVAEKVVFLESVTDQELLSLYRRAKVFALTSISTKRHFEGFGLVYLEANACGVPAVGSMDSGAEDAIQNGETGFLVPQEDSSAAAEALRKLLTDPGVWQRMSQQGQAWAREHDWQEVGKEYGKLYSL